MIKVRKEVTLVKDNANEVLHEAATAREVVKAMEDVAATAADDAWDIGLQANFKVLHQALFQIVLNFDVEALDVLITIGMVDAAMLEAKAKHKAR